MKIYRKYLVIGLIVLFVGAGILPVTGIIEETQKKSEFMIRQTTWYVDDDNCPGPGNGSIDDPFCKIQYAIDNASDGDTVFVYSGIYHENLIIEKSSFILDGESPETTIIDGSQLDYVIRIPYVDEHPFHKDITISGFTIQNSNAKYGNGILLELVEYVTIYKCIIKLNKFGIRTWHSNDNTIKNNKITNNYWGVFMENEDHSFIENNWLHNNTYGVYLDDCDYMLVLENEFKGQNLTGLAIWGDQVILARNEIIRNNFISNKYHGHFLNSKNKWKENYWEDPGPTISIIGANIIWGNREFPYIDLKLPKAQLDFPCAKKPYTITPW